MTFSLRTKLFLLVVASIALTVIPVIAFTYRDLQQSNAELERESFGNMVVLVEDSISSRYLNLLTNKVVDVLQRKAQLRRFSLLARAAWLDMHTAPSPMRDRFITNWTEQLASFGVHMDFFDAAGKPRRGSGQLALLSDDATRADFKGRPIGSLLDARNLPPEGEFAVFAARQSDGGHAPLLIQFLPVPETGHVIAAAMLLSDIVQQASYSEQQIIRSTQEKFHTLSLYRNGFISLISGSGELLAHQGNSIGRDVHLIPREALEEAKSKGQTEYIDEQAEQQDAAIFRVAYVKALDWYVVSAAPRAEIEAPANALVSKLASIALVAAFISIFGTLFITAKLITPLRALTRKTHELSAIDFSSPDAESVAMQGLPTKRSDEVGQLAKAFAVMGQALAHNVRELMDTTATKERMQGELNAAHDIQMGILPAPDAAPRNASYRAAAFLEPAKEVGGDLYDFFVAPDGRQVVIIGDVSGKGVPAALFMSMTMTLCRYAIRSGLKPGEAMTRINDQLSENNPGCMFVTLFIGMFDPESGVLDYANGGHCLPYVVDASGDAPPFLVEGMSGPLVGAMEGMEYTEQRIVLEPGQRCLLYTDGVTEAMNEALELFDETRLAQTLNEHRNDTPEEILQAIYAATVTYRGAAEQSDDITMLCFMRV